MKENPKQYWARVREIEKTLLEKFPGGVYLSTLASDNGLTPGLIKIAAPLLAAECLAKKTHEIATPEQVAAYEAQQKREARRIHATESRLHGGLATQVVLNEAGATFVERRFDIEAKRV